MQESMQDMKRSKRVAEVTQADVDTELCLMGWCHQQRDLGKIVFMTLRDRSGELQLVVDEESPEELLAKAQKVRSEYVLAVRGKLRNRKDPNPEMETGAWELHVTELRILSPSKTPPFYIENDDQARESLRLEYRYLDLRRPVMQKNLMLRSKATLFTRNWFAERGFIDVETPTFIKSTPEGARDYLVPSRVFPGKFFALPQSPQILKQLLMVAGFDRYMQIARCYRDEDLRADRQPEFTQLDLELSFASEEEIFELLEHYMHDLFREILGVELELPFQRLSWDEAMCRFGSDKPDMRMGMEIQNISERVQDLDFQVFRSAIDVGGMVGCLVVPGGASFKRRRLDELTDFAKSRGAKGLVWMAYEDKLRGSATKFLDQDFMDKLAQDLGANKGDLFLFIADEKYKALDILGRLRLEVGEELDLIDKKAWRPLWVIHFPMFEYDEENQRLVAAHHPFTQPLAEDYHDESKDPLEWRANAYDMVLNGYELGSGSLRIFDQEMQNRIFSLIGMSDEEAHKRFGFLLKAFDYGVPPHAGIALGLDRLVMLLCGCDNIREVIAFPKVQNSTDLMMSCPDYVDPEQLEELGITIRPEQKSSDAE